MRRWATKNWAGYSDAFSLTEVDEYDPLLQNYLTDEEWIAYAIKARSLRGRKHLDARERVPPQVLYAGITFSCAVYSYNNDEDSGSVAYYEMNSVTYASITFCGCMAICPGNIVGNVAKEAAEEGSEGLGQIHARGGVLFSLDARRGAHALTRPGESPRPTRSFRWQCPCTTSCSRTTNMIRTAATGSSPGSSF